MVVTYEMNDTSVTLTEDKQCSLEQWQSHYQRDSIKRSKNSPFSRLRGKTIDPVTIVKRGAWSDSDRFGRCPFCKGLTIYGVCQSCRCVRVCSGCKKVIQKDGSVLPLPYDINRDPVTHGFCLPCAKEHYPEMYEKLLDRRLAS